MSDDSTIGSTNTINTTTQEYLQQLAQYTNMTNTANQLPATNYTQQPNYYYYYSKPSSGGTLFGTGTGSVTTTGLKLPTARRYVERPDEPNIEEDFLPKEERDAIIYIPRVGTTVAFSSKNGVVRTGKVNGISVHKPFIRSVECEKGNSVFVNFAESDWYYVKEPD